jgi:hypothetical protein
MRIAPILPIMLGLAATGCSALSQGNAADAGPPPVFTSVVAPATASIGADGYYDFTPTISFTSTSAVQTILAASTALMYSDTITISAATSVHGGAVPFLFSPNFASGTQGDWELTLVAESGAESTPYSGTVTLE